ncbi:DUF6507 family protein [Nocardiopsis sp. EMB25]|uniref:DUF6507 family protein n=1 Tax=Nocardiopsis TaxID=2013 RepID=UPI00034CB2B6|nr:MULTISPECIES: DUF6507 family protein [Nocardiopsis]MCY9787763.1 DUF6507 family protein [Nocardiopsis sp. EMB25]
MSGWNISPQEVGSVLSATAAHLGEEGGSDGLLGQMDRMETDITQASTHINSSPVSFALGEFAEYYFGLMGDMLSLTASALEATSEATTAYVEGNTEMALEAQRNAGEVPEPEPPTRPGNAQIV